MENHHKSPCLMGKLTISMAIVNSYVNVYQAGYMDLLGIESFDHRQRKRSVTIGDEDCNSV